MADLCLPLDLPDWARDYETSPAPVANDTAGMALAIELARRNVAAGTGGPFGAVLVGLDDRCPVAVGVNRVVSLGSSVLHAEMMAIMRGQLKRGSYTLRLPGCVLYASCEPCAMCLGAVLWSGVRRLVCGAPAAAARAAGFDEGPVFSESYRHLAEAGIEVIRAVLPDQAAAVIADYRARGGAIYNG